MFMSDDKKKKGLVAMIVTKLKDGKGEEMKPSKMNEEGAEEDYSMGIDAAVDEIFAAIEQKDKSSFKQALKNFIDLCACEKESEEYEDEE